MKTKLNREEQTILNGYNAKKLKRSENSNQDLSVAKNLAANTLIKTKAIKILLSEKEFSKLKIKEAETGLPFQALIQALVHQYLDNKTKLSF